ncbi:hypothetical protein [uncultured Stenotrophomonas sp.]|uniref:hypothetical protein n=1 Tax=uncultured Stenotrophomonas sp. TaxID=165438 RepID=UPI0025DB010B|nr:hypothetical protein [uncultured Stenotrophomonas sp.]
MKIQKGFGVLSALLAAAIPAVALANQPTYQDRQMASSDGKQWVERTVRLSDFNGGEVTVQVRLFKDGKGGYVYRYNDQTEPTKLYHQAACEVTNSKARHGETIISGESAVVGWSCEGESDPAAKFKPSASDMVQPLAGYYVFALAPSGSAPIGVNFNSVGTARSQSSLAGKASGALSLDNGRCTTSASDEHTGPFTGTYTLQVVCIGVRRGVIPTAMSACIPRVCSTNNGSINVY